MSEAMETIVNIDPNNAQQMLIDESFNRLVVVDFWADWCNPCKVLMPVLEKLATEYAGRFLLAKVNADEQQMLASQFQVRSLPTVMFIKDGAPVDGFAGAPRGGALEESIREMLDKYLPAPWDAQLAQARLLMEAEDFTAALPLLKQAAVESGQRSDIEIALALAYLAVNRLTDAEEILNGIPLAGQDASYKQAIAQLELKQQSAKTPELSALESRHADDPEDLEIAYELAVQYSQSGHQREALELLYRILQIDLSYKDGTVKKTMTDLFASLGKGDPLSAEYQRKLFSLLY